MDKALSYLALARKAGLIELGEEPVGAITRAGKAALVIVSSDEVNCNTRIVTVVPLTSSPAQLARGDGTYDQVLLTGYGAPSMALTRQVHAVDTDDLTEYRGHLTDADMLRLDAALRRALGI